MNRKLITFFSLLIILAFMGFIIYDIASTRSSAEQKDNTVKETSWQDNWIVSKVFAQTDGEITSVTVSNKGRIYLGGDSFVSSYDLALTKNWKLGMSEKITALAVSGDTIFASGENSIHLLSTAGKLVGEWGPFEPNGIITSVSANRHYVAVADAGSKTVFILRKNGEVAEIIGQGEKKFIIPSPYFEVVITGDDTIYAANTGNHRIEKWTVGGEFISEFGKPGDGPDAFTACCNPSHFAVIPQGFVTAEKGLNRIKILDQKGAFVEFVSSKNNFVRPVPLAVASVDGKTIYAANKADSKLYIFTRK